MLCGFSVTLTSCRFFLVFKKKKMNGERKWLVKELFIAAVTEVMVFKEHVSCKWMMCHF